MRIASAAIGSVLFLVSWGLLHHGFYARERIVDTPVYERYGEAMTRGQVPYRDFASSTRRPLCRSSCCRRLGEGDFDDDYERRFEGLMAALGVACVLLVAFTASSWWAPLSSAWLRWRPAR